MKFRFVVLLPEEDHLIKKIFLYQHFTKPDSQILMTPAVKRIVFFFNVNESVAYGWILFSGALRELKLDSV